MNVFLEQFYEIPVDKTSVFLKRIFSNYSQMFSKVKTIKNLTSEEALKYNIRGAAIDSNSIKEHVLFEFEDYKFILTICKYDAYFSDFGNNYAFIEYLENYENQPYKIGYSENVLKNGNEEIKEYHVAINWGTDKVVSKRYTLLEYANNISRSILCDVSLYEPLNNGTDKASIINMSLFVKRFTWLNKNSQKHRQIQPAEITYTKNMTHVIHECWYSCNKLHRLNLPAEIAYDLKKRVKKEAYFKNNKKHSSPNAETYYNYADKCVTKIWYENDELIKTDQEKIV